MHKKSLLLVIGLMFCPQWVCLALAQAQAPPNQRPKEPAGAVSPLYWSVNTMMDGYIQQMTRYYNLTPEQQDYTRSLMNQRVKRFLGDYEKDVRWLAAEMFDYQMKREMPPAEIAKEWGTRAKPLLAAVKQEIFDGNNEWRKVLTDPQRKQHDRDLEQMRKEFDNFEQRFDRWSKGEVMPTDFPGTISNQPLTVRHSEDAWEYRVRIFIQDYNLDKGQQQTAYSVLRQLREEAKRYRDAHKDEFTKLETSENEAIHSPPKTNLEELKRSQDEARQRADRRKELQRPLAELFDRLKAKLDEIPTAEQRLARQQRDNKLSQLARPRTTQPASATQPAVATQPSGATRPAAAADATPAPVRR